MNVILGLCHSYSGKVVTFQESLLLVNASFRRHHVFFVVNMVMSSIRTMEVLAREKGWFKRKVREAIEIKTLQPTINRDQGFDLPAIYSEILPVSVTRDRSRQTSGHPAQTIGAVASSSPTKKT